MNIQYGYKLAPEQFGPKDLVAQGVAAETAGFHFLDASDHFHPWDPAGQSPFTWAVFGAIAAQTHTIVLSSGVTAPILRYHPSIVAQAAATISAMSGGRFFLGVGTGEALNEFSSTGMWPSYTERREMLAEAIELMRELWQGDEVTFNGEYYQTNKAKLYTPPVAPIKVIVSSLVPQSAAFAGQWGDGIWTVAGEEPSVYEQQFGAYDEAAVTAGKQPEEHYRIIELFVGYGGEVSEMERATKQYWAGAMVPAMYSENLYTPELSAKNGAIIGTDTLHQKAVLSNDPADHIKAVQQYLDLGFTHIAFHSAAEDQLAFIEQYGRDVLSQLPTA